MCRVVWYRADLFGGLAQTSKYHDEAGCPDLVIFEV
jgi:hypothetical protein